MRERDIFIEALQRLEEPERQAYLTEACGDDEGLRRRVEQLLAEHLRQESFILDQPPLGATNDTLEQHATLPAGAQIGPYKLLQQIGEGGFGVVYMAEQYEPVRRRLALKIIKPGMDTRQVIARFEAERQALAVMDHPNIAKVFDAGATPAGRPYFVMELVRGTPITQYCDDNNLTVRERLFLFASVCRAIQHAHTKGIIHRDVKPSNILVTRQEGEAVVKVIDFGIAKAMGRQLTEKTLFTEFAQMIGTPLYMSPEQAELSGIDIDTRSDIYSLGVLLYELLTGSTPVQKEQLKKAAFDEIRRIIREEDPPRPSTRISTTTAAPSIAAQRHTEPSKLARLVRGELDWIVMKALEKDRSRRYETASSLAKDVEHYLHDEPVMACPPGAGYRLRKFVRKNRRFLGTLAALVMLLVAATVGAAVSAVQARKLADKEQELRTAAEQRVKVEADARRELDLKLYIHRIALAQQELYAQNTGRAHELLEECPRHLRGWEWYFLKRFRPGNPLSLDENTVCGGFSPDGRYMVVRQNFRQLVLLDPDTGESLRTLQGVTDGIDYHAYAFGRCRGELLLAAGEMNNKVVRVWNVETGECIATLPGHSVRLRTVAFSPDGERLAVGCIDGGAKVWDWRAGRVAFELPHFSVSRLAFSPDGKHLSIALFDSEKAVAVVNANTGREVRAFGSHPAGIEGLMYRRDGRHVVTCGSDGAIRIWDAANGELLRTLRGHTGEVKDVIYTPDGKRLVSAGWDKTVKVWDPETGQETLTLRGHSDIVMKLAFNPAGDRLASSTPSDAKVWNAAPFDEHSAPAVLTLPGHRSYVNSVSFSPDGRLLASTGADRVIMLFPVASFGKRVLPKFRFQADSVMLGTVAFSPDSRRLASAGWSGRLKCWSTETGQQLLAVPLNTREKGDDIHSLVFSPDGRRIANVGPGALAERDANTGEKVVVISIPSGNLNHIACSPDGRYLAVCNNNHANIWDRQTAKQMATVSQRNMVWCAAFSPDGKRLATASFDHTVALWDTATWRRIRTMRGHTDRVMSVAFNHNGEQIASGSGDGSVKVWETASGRELLTFRGHTGHIWSVAFSADGRWLASAGGHEGKGELKVWNVMLTLDIATQPEAVKRSRRETTDFYRLLMNVQPKVPDHRRHRGDMFMREQQWNEAAEEYTRAIELNPALLREIVDYLLASDEVDESVRMIDRLAAAYRTIASRIPDARQATSWTVLASAYFQIGHRYRAQHQQDKGLAAFQQGVNQFETYLASVPECNPDYLLWHANRCNDLAFLLPAEQRATEGERLVRRAIEIKQSIIGKNSENASCRFHLAHSHFGLFYILQDSGRTEEAVQAVADADAQLRVLGNEALAIRSLNRSLGSAFWQLGDAWTRIHRFEEGEQALQQALAVYQQLEADDTENVLLRQEQGTSCRKLADLMQRAKRRTDEQRYLLQALEIYDNLRSRAPDSEFYRQEAAALHFRLGQMYARYAEWDKAVAEHALGLKLAPADHESWWQTAPLYLAVKNEAGYLNHCQEMLDRFEQQSDVTVAGRTAMSCLLTPHTIHLERAVALADRSVEGTEMHDAFAFFARAKGLAELRSGRPAEAVLWLERSGSAVDGGAPDAASFSALAMARHKLGHGQQAQEALAHAKAIVGAKMPTPATGTLFDDWVDWLHADILTREAEAMLSVP